LEFLQVKTDYLISLFINCDFVEEISCLLHCLGCLLLVSNFLWVNHLQVESDQSWIT
jgi:hypothetical protein